MEMVWKRGPFTNGPNVLAKFQKRGGLVVRTGRDKTIPTHEILWDNGVDGDSEYQLKLQDYGKIDIINANGVVVWGKFGN